MYKIYKTLENISVYKKIGEREYLTGMFREVLKDNYLYLEEENSEYKKIKGYDYYVKKQNIEEVINKPIEKCVSILMYHEFYDPEANETKVNHNYISIKVFYNQMKYLYDNDYKTITQKELNQYINGEIDLPKKTVMITMDDATISQYKYAFPILKKFNFKASCAVITSELKDEPGHWHLNAEMFNEMRESGAIEFYSHSHKMHDYKNNIGVFLIQNEEQSIDDLKKSINILNNNLLFCYPFGHFNKKTESVLKQLGFEMALTTQHGKVKPGINKLEIPRIRIEETMSIEDFIDILEI